MRISDRLLFLKYALPCASTLVRRGNVKQEYLDSLILMVSDNRVPKENAEEMFRVANAMCESIAARMKKSSIDTEVIRQYFVMEHSKVVDDRYELMRDFNPVDCRTYTGEVVSLEDGEAVVSTVLGNRRYKTLFAKDIKKNDKVIVHYDYVIEKLPEAIAEKMQSQR